MANAVAKSKGYMLGRVIEKGERFAVPFDPADKRWPSWASPVGKGEAVEAKAETVDDEPAKAKGKGGRPAKGKAETVVTEPAEPFGDAPAPEAAAPAGNGIQSALGGVEPDWVQPAAV